MRGKLEKQAQFADLDRLLHDVHAEEVVQDDAFKNEVTAVRVCRDAVEYASEILEFLVREDGITCRGKAAGCRFCFVRFVAQEGFHAVEAAFIEWFEDVERGEEKGAGAAGRIQDSDFLNRVPECAEQVRPFAVGDDVLGELANIQVEGDEIVDVGNVAARRVSCATPRIVSGGRLFRARSR